MAGVDALGYLAALLVLATFCMRGMVALRAMAIASNLAFIGYAAIAGIHPVLLLHALLLPMNVWRLAEVVMARSAAFTPRPAPKSRARPG
jgi:CRP/FNR family cyclic AMP-dependent transcriptional regulator